MDGGRLRSSNPSEYGFVYSAERPSPAPEVGWKDKGDGDVGPVNLYSENVVKEGDTTESVDRESIANLSSTKQRWEHIFTSNKPVDGAEAGSVTPRKKNPPKWEVRLHYKEWRAPAPQPQTEAEQEQDQAVASAAAADDDAVSSPPTSTSVFPTSNSSSSLAEPDQPASSAPPISWSSTPSDGFESAIEREIRLAHEREAMLKQEIAERSRQQQQHQEQPQSSSQQVTPSIASCESPSAAESEAYQTPAFEELAEADRAPDLWVSSGRTNWEQAEREPAERAAAPVEEESLIEREIRLAQEREAEVARLRQMHAGNAAKAAQTVTSQTEELSGGQEDGTQSPEVRDSDSPEISISSQHEGESLIARELRQSREREEEIRRLHGRQEDQSEEPEPSAMSTLDTLQKSGSSHLGLSLYKTLAQEEESGKGSRERMTLVTPATPDWPEVDKMSVSVTSQADSGLSSMLDYQLSPARTPVEQAPSARNVHGLVETAVEDDQPEVSRPTKQETPIEREMRIARERENEIRRMKGLPELKASAEEEDEFPGLYAGNRRASSSEGTSGYSGSLATPRSGGSNSMKRFASNRLHQELQLQKQREQDLRNEGKIISTSEEHIQPLKYTEVAGVDRVDGTEKRNFISPSISGKRLSFSSDIRPAPSPQTPDVVDDGNVSSSVSSSGGGGATASKKGNTASSGGKLFSYKEFKQTAESKIEQELREMREREEELKQLRVSHNTKANE